MYYAVSTLLKNNAQAFKDFPFYKRGTLDEKHWRIKKNKYISILTVTPLYSIKNAARRFIKCLVSHHPTCETRYLSHGGVDQYSYCFQRKTCFLSFKSGNVLGVNPVSACTGRECLPEKLKYTKIYRHQLHSVALSQRLISKVERFLVIFW